MAQFTGEALKGFLLVNAKFCLKPSNPVLDFFLSSTSRGCAGVIADLRKGFDQQGDFATDTVAGGELLAGERNCSADKFFVNFGQLAGYGHAQTRPPDRFQVGQGLNDPMGCLVEDDRSRHCDLYGQVFKPAAAGAGLLWQETQELKLSGRKP